MRAPCHDRLLDSTEHFIRAAADRIRIDATQARACFHCGSPLGVRHHLTSLRRLAERRARLERHVLHQSSTAPRLTRAADAALEALEGPSQTLLIRALDRVEALAR